MRSVAGTLVVVVFAVAGCGGGAPSAQQILSEAIKAADAASSVHVTGTIAASGTGVGIDLWIAKDRGAKGSLTLGGANVRLIIVGNNGYINGRAPFLTRFADSPELARLGGRWLNFPVHSPGQFEPIVAFASRKVLFDQLLSGGGSAAKSNGDTTYKGKSVISVYDGAKNGTLYVAATGTPYPVALVQAGSSGGALTFGGWNHAVTLTAPKNALDAAHLHR